MRERVVLPRCFDLRQTLDCGQAFRWRELSSEEEFEAVWRGYFDLDADYEEKRRRLSAISPILAEASSYAPGIRILRQDSWEALCSFLISQNNNIPRIKGIIERFCQAFGSPIPGSSFFSFPTPEALASRCLEDLVPSGRCQKGGGRGDLSGRDLPGIRRLRTDRAAKNSGSRPQGCGMHAPLRISQNGLLSHGRLDEAGYGNIAS